jgi:cytochrome P450
LITRYDDFRKVLTDPRFSADTTRPGYPSANPGMSLARQKYRTFISMDPPDHTSHRRMLTGDFSVKRMELMRPKLQSIVDQLIDDLIKKGPPAELVEDFCFPLPSFVICELLGVPYADHDFFQERAKIIASNKTTPEEAAVATRELCEEYIGDLIKKKDANPGDDLLSRLVVNYMRPGQLDRTQMIGIARQLLIAGHETTANTTALGILLMLHHPEQIEALRNDPSLANGAVEELLRYLDVTQAGRRRVATEDVEVGGQLIRAGEGIIVANPSADRDETAFPDPDRFDIRRNARHHVAFGYGVHQCLGQPLARIELQVVFGTIFKRLPDLRLAAPFELLQFKNDMFVYGLERLPVVW